ncbi:hypothetical protein B566_EDAN001514 [Ephemera danica]|nr:hypothetical protein B566_EDAN001514 [Ephemera danica]
MLPSQAQKTQYKRLFITWVFLLGCYLEVIDANDAAKTEIVEFSIPPTLLECDNATLICKATPINTNLWWEYEGRNLSKDDRYANVLQREEDTVTSSLTILCVTGEDIGNYTCNLGNTSSAVITETKLLDVQVIPELQGGENVRKHSSNKTSLECLIKGRPIMTVRWSKENQEELASDRVETIKKNKTLAISHLNFQRISRHDNGTYFCTVATPKGDVSASTTLFVLDVPQVNIDVVRAVGANRIFLNWTVNDGNDPMNSYFIQLMKNNTPISWQYGKDPIGSDNTSSIINDLVPSTAYKIKLIAQNSIGSTAVEHKEWVKTLAEDPSFIPEVQVKGVTKDSITIGWSSPPLSVRDHVHYYELILQHNKTKKQAFHPANADIINTYMFEKLEPATTYNFQVAACSEFTRECGNWSREVNGTTMDGVSGPPENVSVSCKFDNISRTSFVFVTWSQPSQPNGQIVRYSVILEGDAKFKNERGTIEEMTWGPKVKNANKDSESARFDVIPPNTNYTVKVSGVTKSRQNGQESIVHCNMPPTVPDKEKMSRFNWGKVEEQGRWMFKLYMPRISERNGQICCYRVVMIKLHPQENVADLPPPEELMMSSYDEVHQRKKSGAYIAELFESDTLSSEVFLGDGLTSTMDHSQCRLCLRELPATPVAPTPEVPTIVVTDGGSATENTTSPLLPETQTTTISDDASGTLKRKRKRSIVSDLYMVHVQDGTLDIDSNYTGFVQVIVFGPDKSLLQAYSNYFVPLKAGPSVMLADKTSQMLLVIVQVLLGLMLVVFVLLLSLCLLQRYTKQVAEAQGVEMTLRNSFRWVHSIRVFFSYLSILFY